MTANANHEVVIGFGGAAGEGIASAGDTLALAVARQGLHLYAYNSYQSVIRGGHSWLRIRVGSEKPLSVGDTLHILVALNQNTLDRHLPEIERAGAALFNSDKVKSPQSVPEGIQLCPLPVPELTELYKKLPVIQNTVMAGALCYLIGLPFEGLASVLGSTFQRKGQNVVDANVAAARAGYEFASRRFDPLEMPLQRGRRRRAVMTGNEAFALGAAAAGCRFYAAYPMTPASGILHWMAAHGEKLGICVRQPEDELAVINMTIGANLAGVRGLCATSGGGFALMTEAVGMAGMLECPLVCVEVQRAGPSTGVPTKTEQGDLNQVFGASQGEFPRVIIAPADTLDCFRTMAESFNLAERFQCPVLVMSDLLLSEHHETVDSDDFNFEVPIDRGQTIARGNGCGAGYARYKITASGISPRALPGVPGYLHVAASDEHDEDGVLISDVYTDPLRRTRMMDKRMRKMEGVLEQLPAPQLEGPTGADVTLVGWGSTRGVIREAVRALRMEGIVASNLQIKYLVPFHSAEVVGMLSRSNRVVVVENNHTGQFARHLRAETGITPDGAIRKYDGEPFEPKHIVMGVKAHLSGTNVVRALSEESGWRAEHPAVTRSTG